MTLSTTSIGADLGTFLVNNFYAGGIDEVATWNRVLTWSEIQQVLTNGVPIPLGVTPPSITTQPQDRTNNVFAGDNVTFSVLASGSEPLVYQWRQNGVPISAALNPSAVTTTLELTNVSAALSNAAYTVVITNAAAAVTSSVVRLYVIPWTAVTNGEALKVDFDLRTLTDLQAGFSQFTLANNPTNFNNAVKLTLSGIGSAIDDRHRPGGPLERFVVNNPPFMTQAQIYNDFVFATSTTDGTGLRILIERLATNTHYGVTIWSFDAVSSPARIANWSDNTSGTPVAITNGYAFDGVNVPTNDFQYVLGGLLTSSASGKLQIESLKNGGGGVAAFINAIRLVANPTATRITSAELIGGNLRIAIESEYPGQPVFIQQRANVATGTWTDPGATVIETRGPITVFEVPASADQMFYRSGSYPTW